MKDIQKFEYLENERKRKKKMKQNAFLIIFKGYHLGKKTDISFTI